MKGNSHKRKKKEASCVGGLVSEGRVDEERGPKAGFFNVLLKF